jgi:ubiquitin carboxyl-terminal hydrolase 20/33
LLLFFQGASSDLTNGNVGSRSLHELESAASRNGLLGLENLGNTCYMNAAIQALSNCYSLTSFFLECSQYIQTCTLWQEQLSRERAASSANAQSNNSSTATPSLSISYMKLMRELWQKPSRVRRRVTDADGAFGSSGSDEVSSVTPLDLVHVIKYFNPMFRGYQQHDSQEFLTFLMDQLHEELKRPLYLNEAQHTPRRTLSTATTRCSLSCDNTNNNNDDDVDSGIGSLISKAANTNAAKTSTTTDDEEESIDSYVTCGDENELEASATLTTSETDLSASSCGDKMGGQDGTDNVGAEVTFQKKKSPNNNNNNSNHEQASQRRLLPMYTSIVSELFEGKIISQVQCLECNNISTTTESFLHLSIPIPSKEYLQSLHTRILTKQNQLNSLPAANMHRSNSSGSASSSSSSVAYQSWLSWIMDFMKGYIWSSTIKLADCLTAFFSDDDLKGDNMYSCEKCKK